MRLIRFTIIARVVAGRVGWLNHVVMYARCVMLCGCICRLSIDCWIITLSRVCALPGEVMGVQLFNSWVIEAKGCRLIVDAHGNEVWPCDRPYGRDGA